MESPGLCYIYLIQFISMLVLSFMHSHGHMKQIIERNYNNIDDYVCVRTGERDTLLGGAESATAAQSTAAPPKSAGAGTGSALVEVRETRPLSLHFRFKNDVFPRQARDKT